MRRLALTLVTALLVLSAVDWFVARRSLGEGASVSLRRKEAFRSLAARRFDEVRSDLRIRVAQLHHQWDSLSADKPAGELRVVLIGNSSALFAVLPGILEERLSEAFPGQTVVVLPLFIEGVRLREEAILLKAAMAKAPDLVVLTPNLRSLRPGGSNRLQSFFEVEPAGDPVDRAVSVVRTVLRRHWRLYRERFAVRKWIWSEVSGGERDLGHIERVLEEISHGARDDGLAGVFEVYERHELMDLAQAERSVPKVPPESPIFAFAERWARRVRASGRAVAIFMPHNPAFRIPDPDRPRPAPLVQNDYARAVADRVMRLYARSGFATYDALDALTASDFVDFVHVNGDGAVEFTENVARVLIRELQRPSAHAPDVVRDAPLGAPARPQSGAF